MTTPRLTITLDLPELLILLKDRIQKDPGPDGRWWMPVDELVTYLVIAMAEQRPPE